MTNMLQAARAAAEAAREEQQRPQHGLAYQRGLEFVFDHTARSIFSRGTLFIGFWKDSRV